MKTLTLTGTIPGKKVRTIKAVRWASRVCDGTGLSLRDAKGAVDRAERGEDVVLYTGEEDACLAARGALHALGVPARIDEATALVKLPRSDMGRLRQLAWSAGGRNADEELIRLGDRLDDAFYGRVA